MWFGLNRQTDIVTYTLEMDCIIERVSVTYRRRLGLPKRRKYVIFDLLRVKNEVQTDVPLGSQSIRKIDCTTMNLPIDMIWNRRGNGVRGQPVRK